MHLFCTQKERKKATVRIGIDTYDMVIEKKKIKALEHET